MNALAEHQFVSDVETAFKAEGIPAKHLQVWMSAYKAWAYVGPAYTLRTYLAGLGSPSRFPEAWFEPKHGQRVPRQKQWWCLTDAGARIMDSVVAKYPWPADKNLAGRVALLIHANRLP